MDCAALLALAQRSSGKKETIRTGIRIYRKPLKTVRCFFNYGTICFRTIAGGNKTQQRKEGKIDYNMVSYV